MKHAAANSVKLMLDGMLMLSDKLKGYSIFFFFALRYCAVKNIFLGLVWKVRYIYHRWDTCVGVGGGLC